ncbi:MAG: TetR family transcriptional regulator [Cytophagaceae bacterium]|nr:TetR family transcriptional regulator [Cytophagaceae bacterium]|tara:strand:- start:3685 stop:4239 length:555 start_codon:yes stop_codon:yes gene_type:complete
MTDTKKRIIESGIKIFNEDLSAPLQKVADNAEVTRRTLHRYFKDRNELVEVCKQAIDSSCKKAMIAAIQSSDEPIIQLERMLYAGIDCGAKYSVFYKLHQSKDHKHTHQNKNCVDYDYIYNQFQGIIIELQKKGRVNLVMSPEWIQVLHSGIIESTVNARETTTKSFEEIKELAWISYIKAIAP